MYYTAGFYKFTLGKKDGNKGGMIQRRCTGTYKVKPISKMLTVLRKETKAKKVRQWIGISYDELHRMKTNSSPNVINYYPLVENEIDRNDCHLWLQDHGWRAPKSSCIGCPYHNDNIWLWLKEYYPDDFNEAVEFDNKIRIQNNVCNIVKLTYVREKTILNTSVFASNNLRRIV